MAPILCNAKALKAGDSGWTVIVQVLQRFPPMRKRVPVIGQGNKYQKIVLLDMEGTVISAVMYDATIQAFPHLLHPYKRYKISNARITDVLKRYRISDYNYTWTISPRTPIELIEDILPHPMACPFQLVPFSELYKHADKDISINIMGLLVHIFPETISSSRAPIRKFTLVTPENIPVNLTIWIKEKNDCSADINDAMVLPVCILATNVRVSTYEGISLRTEMFTYLMLNPPMVETASLLQWFDSPEMDRSLWQVDTMYKNPQRFFRMPLKDELMLLKDAVDHMFKLRTVWVKGELRYNNGAKGPCTVICGNCKKPLDTDPANMINCMFCQKYCLTELSLRLTFLLSDKSTSISVSMTSPVADAILSMSAAELQRNHDQHLLETKIQEAVNNRQYLCFIKVFYTNFNQQQIPHYSVLQLYAVVVHDVSSVSGALETIQPPNSTLHIPACSPPRTPAFVNPTNKEAGKSTIPATHVRKTLDFTDIPSDECDPKVDAGNSGKKKGKIE